MNNVRLIARLDIKGENLIKGIRMEGLRVMGEPNAFAKKYYEDGVDELIYMDCVASLYGRNHLAEIIERAAENIFVPMTVGGGIRSVDDARNILRLGADKIAINTAAVENPNLISELAYRFGSQAVVLSVEAKKNQSNQWEVYTHGGRERTGLDVLEWISVALLKGAGEVLLTSVDREGTRNGFDLALLKEVSAICSVPLIASGGMGKVEDLMDAVNIGGVGAIAMADILHYKRLNLPEIRNFALNNNLPVRHYAN
ncbi:imidazole glycerol phosphate synthase subunit HisF [Polynucleobacter sp. AP-Kaivos-20-H2]|uniref:imidazole glycerol phosphate synthase subunit HisF n=1 Tax=Polynucleobacter sp. AP-Kaivos-20-H2 TaxID=2689104 RepID=UPI001C0D0C9C|nr:imidazole glycerol phosphate synthase cyclase subunit [Polynucleobacter sp. AP-Kaivos-20-H2]MBU3604131.1 imidazole glycerol phosphate synthase subunit HisF [Polynucleobacter sp. AP-Kaivos-20-H2]